MTSLTDNPIRILSGAPVATGELDACGNPAVELAHHDINIAS